MGCDIHLYKEKKVNGVWVTADDGWEDKYGEGLDLPFDANNIGRDYNLFGLLANVRRDCVISFKPRGIPFNACDNVRNASDQYDTDGHSHSYLTLNELKEVWEVLPDMTNTVSGMMHVDQHTTLMESINGGTPDWDLMYPYCQGSNHPAYVEFEIEVPAVYDLSGLKLMIDLFDGIDGDDHRFVFWFDN